MVGVLQDVSAHWHLKAILLRIFFKDNVQS